MVNGYLTEEQRKHWDEQGYLIVKRVLSPRRSEHCWRLSIRLLRTTSGKRMVQRHPSLVEVLSPSFGLLKEQMRWMS